MSKTPSLSKLKDDLVKICPDGDLKATHSKLDYILDFEKKDDGSELTYEYLLKKYEDHIKWWNHNYGRGGDLKYVKAKDLEKKKTFYDFLDEGKYNDEWQVTKGDLSRDRYLFGDFSIDYLKRLKDQFINQFKI